MNNLGNIAKAEKVALRDISYYYSGCNCISSFIRNPNVTASMLYDMGKEIRIQNRLLNNTQKKTIKTICK
jgi:tyrosine-protein phosphatase YwqE